MHYARLKTPISYYGGKQSHLKTTLPLIPEHEIYTEAFFGGGALYFAKKPSAIEVINDLDREVVNFFEQLKTHPRKLKKRLVATLHSRLLYKEALVTYRYGHLFTPLDRAWAFWVVTNQGFQNAIGSWSFSKSRPTKGLHTNALDFDALASRLEKTQIECHDALSVIRTRDSEKSFHYIDPPYMGANQGHYRGYGVQEYKELLKVLQSIQGSFLLCSYPSDILSDYARKNGWHIKSIDRHISCAKKTQKQEVLVANYNLEKRT